MYLITVGGSDKITLAVWKVKDIIEFGKKERKGVIIKGLFPFCEYTMSKITLHSFYFDNHNSDYNTLNIVMGAEKGIKFFTVKV